MFKSLHITTAYGIPIKLHWSLYIAVPLLMFSSVPPQAYILWLLIIAGLLLSVALHEIGHSILALKKGLNVQGILLTPIGGIASLTDLPENSNDEIQIAIAGPLVSIALALLFALLSYLAVQLKDPFLYTLTLNLFKLNTMLALFNLIPAFPMDGGRIFRAWMTPKKGRVQATRIAVEIGKYLAILGALWGLFGPGPTSLVLISAFIYLAAKKEYALILMQEQHNQANHPFGAPQPTSTEGFSASPPPYIKSQNHIMQFNLLRETYTAYRILQHEFITLIRNTFSAH